MKKIILLAIVLCFYMVLNAKTGNEEEQLITLYNKVQGMSLRLNKAQEDNLKLAYSDSLEATNKRLVDLLLNVLSDNSSLQESFEKLKSETEISIVESTNFRFGNKPFQGCLQIN